MKIFLKALTALLLLSLAVWAIRSDSQDPGVVDAAPLAAAAPEGGDPAWRRSALWDDGKAEFCGYDVIWARYGHRFYGRAQGSLTRTSRARP